MSGHGAGGPLIRRQDGEGRPRHSGRIASSGRGIADLRLRVVAAIACLAIAKAAAVSVPIFKQAVTC